MIRKYARPLFWIALALPALLMLVKFKNGSVLAMDLLHPSGEMAVRLMLLAMLPGPLMGVFGSTAILRKWMTIRRHLGVSACGYALLHTYFYLADMLNITAIWEEFAITSIWMGWLALILLLPPTAISSDHALRYLGKQKWKFIQMLVYPAMLITILHWLLLDWHWQPALIHLAPLIVVWAILLIKNRKSNAPNRT